MPPIRRRNIGRRSRTATSSRNSRAIESPEHRANRIERNSQRMLESRLIESHEDQAIRNEENRLRQRRRIASINRSDDNHQENNIARRVQRQAGVPRNYFRTAFRYDSSTDYSTDNNVVIGSMSIVCSHCKALKFPKESPGLCCANGKIKLPPFNPPPEPLYSLVSGSAPLSKHFLNNIQKYNSCFQMTSFGATNIVRDNFMPTFKVINWPHVNKLHFSSIHTTVADSRSNLP